MQRRTDLWGPDALTFDPERWLDQRNDIYKSNPFIFQVSYNDRRCCHAAADLDRFLLSPSRPARGFASARTSVQTFPPLLSSTHAKGLALKRTTRFRSPSSASCSSTARSTSRTTSSRPTRSLAMASSYSFPRSRSCSLFVRFSSISTSSLHRLTTAGRAVGADEEGNLSAALQRSAFHIYIYMFTFCSEFNVTNPGTNPQAGGWLWRQRPRCTAVTVQVVVPGAIF